MMRLLHTLRATQPASAQHFANLAALHIRRELLDLARHFRNRLDRHPAAEGASGEGAAELPDPDSGLADDLDLWSAFHEQVDLLPADEREVVGLTFYHGWTQAQVAELCRVDERTVRRRWRSAALKLTVALGGRLPQLKLKLCNLDSAAEQQVRRADNVRRDTESRRAREDP
jgi:RNA polymerase sigma-70 factor (ECF subfamily)